MARANERIIIDRDGDFLEINSDGSINAITTETVATDMEGGGMVAVGTTAVECSFTGITKTVIITADPDNTGFLFIGKSDVASDGSNAITLLAPGETWQMDYNDSANAIYVVASTTGQNFWKGALIL